MLHFIAQYGENEQIQTYFSIQQQLIFNDRKMYTLSVQYGSNSKLFPVLFSTSYFQIVFLYCSRFCYQFANVQQHRLNVKAVSNNIFIKEIFRY